jgi:hypothetical protein
MFTSFSHEHLENTNESITGNVLIAFHEGGGHRLNLLMKPLEEIRQRGTSGEFSTSSAKHSYGGLSIASKLGEPLVNKILKSLQLRLFSLLHQLFVLHRNIVGNAHTFKISFETFFFEGQSSLVMLNLCQLCTSSIHLHSQQGVILLQLCNARDLLCILRFCQV